MYTLSDVAKKGATLFPDKVAMVYGDTRIRYHELNERVTRFANALIGLGCKKGDRLTILSENTYKYMEVYFAAARAGMSVTPLNFRLSDSELIHIVNDSEASIFLAGEGYEERAYALKNDFINIPTTILSHIRQDHVAVFSYATNKLDGSGTGSKGSFPTGFQMCSVSSAK